MRPHDILPPIARVSVSNSEKKDLLDEGYLLCPAHSGHDKQRKRRYWRLDCHLHTKLFRWLPVAYTSEQFQRLMTDNGVVCSMSRSGNVWDNAAMESFFSSLKTERTARKMYRSRDEARADVFDYIERFYNPKRRHSTIGYMSPMEFERQAGLA